MTAQDLVRRLVAIVAVLAVAWVAMLASGMSVADATAHLIAFLLVYVGGLAAVASLLLAVVMALALLIAVAEAIAWLAERWRGWRD